MVSDDSKDGYDGDNSDEWWHYNDNIGDGNTVVMIFDNDNGGGDVTMITVMVITMMVAKHFFHREKLILGSYYRHSLSTNLVPRLF
jgi:hypothetical protein